MTANVPEGLIYYRVLEDGRAIGVTPQLFGAAIITIGRATDTATYDEQWMYNAEVGGVARALVEAAHWQPDEHDEPDGWVRTTYRAAQGCYRRRPDGNVAREYKSE